MSLHVGFLEVGFTDLRMTGNGCAVSEGVVMHILSVTNYGVCLFVPSYSTWRSATLL